MMSGKRMLCDESSGVFVHIFRKYWDICLSSRVLDTIKTQIFSFIKNAADTCTF